MYVNPRYFNIPYYDFFYSTFDLLIDSYLTSTKNWVHGKKGDSYIDIYNKSLEYTFISVTGHITLFWIPGHPL